MWYYRHEQEEKIKWSKEKKKKKKKKKRKITDKLKGNKVVVDELEDDVGKNQVGMNESLRWDGWWIS